MRQELQSFSIIYPPVAHLYKLAIDLRHKCLDKPQIVQYFWKHGFTSYKIEFYVMFGCNIKKLFGLTKKIIYKNKLVLSTLVS